MLPIWWHHIYQLGKAFRAEEKGQYHDNEFTMLEWYRIGFSLEELMSEVYQLIVSIIGDKKQKNSDSPGKAAVAQPD